MEIQFIGKNIIADEVFPIPPSSQGWISNNTDVVILLTFANGTTVNLAIGQTHNWNPNGSYYYYSAITVSVVGMTSGFVGICYTL